MRKVRHLALVTAAALAWPSSAQMSKSPAGKGLDPANLDPSCRACDDFYRYAVGGWMDRNPIPETRSSWSSYAEVEQRTNAELKSILENAAATAAGGDTSSTRGKLGLFYTRCLDTERATREGVRPIQPVLQRIDRLTDRGALQEEITRLQLRGGDLPIAFFSYEDPQNSRDIIGALYQGGTTLADIAQYSSDEPSAQEARERLLAYAARLFELSGLSREAALADAERVMRMETELARNSLTPVQMRDQQAITNRMRRADVAALTPHWNWNDYLAAVGAPGTDLINVTSPNYLRAVDRMLAERPLEEWRAYLRWRLLNSTAQWLSPEFADPRFAFNASFSGTKAQEPRWEQCKTAANELMTEAVGREYVERVFTPEVRAYGLRMVENLKAVLHERLTALSWMGDATRKEALAKLDAMAYYVGGPRKWTDFGPLALPDGAFVDQIAAVSEFQIRVGNARIGHPADPERWDQPAQRVSGAYMLSRNHLVYPAAKFQPPFFDPKADDAVNYGAIGSTIGHEVAHGFDDQGREYDAAGNLRDWWTPEDAARYKEQADKLAAQFDGYTVNGDKVNGRLSLGENLADLGGLTISYYALQKALKGKPRTKIDGFTPEQRFFLSWAQNWRLNMRPERMRMQVKVGPHAPMPLRVIGPLSNMPEFAAAFDCKPGDKMVRSGADRVKIF